MEAPVCMLPPEVSCDMVVDAAAGCPLVCGDAAGTAGKATAVLTVLEGASTDMATVRIAADARSCDDEAMAARAAAGCKPG